MSEPIFTPPTRIPHAYRNVARQVERAKFLFETGEAVELIAAALEVPTNTVLTWAAEGNWTRPPNAPAVDLSKVKVGPNHVPSPLAELVEAQLADIPEGTPAEQCEVVEKDLDLLGELAISLPDARSLPFEDWGNIYKKLMCAEMMRLPFLVRKLTPKEFFANAPKINTLNEVAMKLMGIKDLTGAGGRSIINMGIISGESRMPPDDIPEIKELPEA